MANGDVKNTLNNLHDKYVVVPAGKASNNLNLVCRHYYIHCLQKELGLLDDLGNPTYILTSLSKNEILSYHHSVLQSFHIPVNEKRHGSSAFVLDTKTSQKSI